MLRRLGDALANDSVPHEGCPTYTDVMLWHNDLAAEVAATIAVTDWKAAEVDLFDLAARSKTLDTLVQKLRRQPPKLTLEQVQDLAGVRVDGDFTLDQQLELATEVAAHFGPESIVKDIRHEPHSGYRAVHVWLRLPCGRAEIQFRTVGQSAWANAYERLGDKFGRGIRYGEDHENGSIQKLVDQLHEISNDLAHIENLQQELVNRERELARIPEVDRGHEHDAACTELTQHTVDLERSKMRYVELLRELKRTLDAMEEN